MEGSTNTALPANSTIGSVHAYREVGNRLLFSELLPGNCRSLPGVTQGCLLGPILFLLFVDDLPNTVKLRHGEVPVTPVISRSSRASILSQTVMPCNLILTISSVGPNHLGSYFITPSVNASALNFRLYPFFPVYL